MAFKPNRELLNVHFDGYKLSDTSLRQLRSELIDGVKRKQMKSDCFSYQHMRQATMTNLLITDKWSKSASVYWIADTNKIMTAALQSTGGIAIKSVFEDMRPSENTAIANPSLVFISSTMALFSDPSLRPSHVLLLDTGQQRDDPSGASSHDWTIICQVSLPVNDFVIECARIEGDALNIVTSSLQSQASSDVTCSVQCFEVNVPQRTPQLISLVNGILSWTLTSSSTPLHCELLNGAVLIVNETELHESSHLHSAAREDEAINCRDNNDDDEMGVSAMSHSGLGYSVADENYSWDQTGSDVTVTIPLQDDISKMDISCVIERDSLVAGLTDGTTFVRGDLFGTIDTEASTWTFQKNKLEIVLEKVDQDIEWSSLLCTAAAATSSRLPLQREMLGLTEDEMKELQKRIDAMNSGEEKGEGKRESEGSVDSSSKRSKPIMANMMEDCDVSNGEEVKCFLVNLHNGQIMNKVVTAGKQLLFSLPPTIDTPTYLCLKHDIDALLFSLVGVSSRPTTTLLMTQQWDHAHTFNALGYVQASKREKKFLTCDSTCSYCVLTDCNRHVFIYRQPAAGIKGNEAVQYVHTFTTAEEILGVSAAREGVVFVLRENTLDLLLLV